MIMLAYESCDYQHQIMLLGCFPIYNFRFFLVFLAISFDWYVSLESHDALLPILFYGSSDYQHHIMFLGYFPISNFRFFLVFLALFLVISFQADARFS